MKAVVALWCFLVALTAAADLDLANLEKLQQDERPVSPERLAALIGEANRVVVTQSPRDEAKPLFESRERKDLDALSKALVVTKPERWFHCMCLGTPALSLYKDDKLLVQITNQHGKSVRCSLWSSDAPLADVENWLKWFDDRKLAGPRKEVEELRALGEESERDWKKWVAALPKGLEPVWESSLDQFGRADTEPLMKALQTSIPAKEDQILALLQWFGSGAGPWSGFPSYESAAEDLLLEYQIADVVLVVKNQKLTPAQTEGAARLFGGWDFSKKHPKGLDEVPAELKRALWEHVKNTTDKDKLGRARSAFNPKE